MKIVLAGGSGFLGRALASRLALAGHDIVVLTRGERLGRPSRGLSFATWQPDGTIPLSARQPSMTDGTRGRTGDWSSVVDGADAVVNLAGAGIADERWTPARKALLRSSRVDTTRSLLAACRSAIAPPGVFVQASAVGYYGVTGDAPIDETSPVGSDFLATLCAAWEAEAQPASAFARLVTLRSGVVLARDGGALKRMLPPFLAFVGGRLGSGRQVMSWIQRDDWISMVAWALETEDVSGPVNATAPKPVTNREFSRALGRAVHRPSLLMVPAVAVRAMVGPELAELALLGGQRVLPKRALALKFGFRYPDIDRALTSIFAEA